VVVVVVLVVLIVVDSSDSSRDVVLLVALTNTVLFLKIVLGVVVVNIPISQYDLPIERKSL